MALEPQAMEKVRFWHITLFRAVLPVSVPEMIG